MARRLHLGAGDIRNSKDLGTAGHEPLCSEGQNWIYLEGLWVCLSISPDSQKYTRFSLKQMRHGINREDVDLYHLLWSGHFSVTLQIMNSLKLFEGVEFIKMVCFRCIRDPNTFEDV